MAKSGKPNPFAKKDPKAAAKGGKKPPFPPKKGK